MVTFIQLNRGLGPLSKRSRPNLPLPRGANNPNGPVNRPAVGDLMDLCRPPAP